MSNLQQVPGDNYQQKEDILLDKYNEEKRVQYYSGGQFTDKNYFYDSPSNVGTTTMQKKKKKKPGWLWTRLYRYVVR